MVTARSLPIHPYLSDFAHRYMIFEGAVLNGQIFTQAIVPALTEFLTFNLNGEPQYFYVKKEKLIFKDCFVSGLHTEPFEAHLNGNIKLVGLQLKSPGLSRLFGVPMKYISDYAMPLSELIGLPADILCDKLRNTKSIPEAINLIEQFLIRQLIKIKDSPLRKAFQHSLELISHSQGTIPIHKMAREMNRSERSLQRIFMQEAGVSPKMYARMHKFNEVIQHFNSNQKLSLDLIYKLDYYDQAHFIHDFKKFAGESPTTYFKTHPGWNEFFTNIK